MDDKLPRLHALDNLRALMMWLGIVLHVVVMYMVQTEAFLAWHDETATRFADVIFILIHSFRMPVFFILAGFFAALLVQRHGLGGMVKNRVLRLGVPFALFWLPLTVAVVVPMLAYLHLMQRGIWGLDVSLVPPQLPQGPSTLHLWFIWMLLWMCAALVPLAWMGHKLPSLRAAVAKTLRVLTHARWGFLLLAVPQAWVGSFYEHGVLSPSGLFLPGAGEWLHNGLFFVVGYTLFQYRQQALPRLQQRWFWHAAAGGVGFAVSAVLLLTMRVPMWVNAYAYCATGWLWSFAWIGAALRFTPEPRAWLSYLARSAYWVYLVHFPLTIAFGALLYGVPVPALVKIVANIAVTTLVCLLTYHWGVRNSFVGRLLNGRQLDRQLARQSATL